LKFDLILDKAYFVTQFGEILSEKKKFVKEVDGEVAASKVKRDKNFIVTLARFASFFNFISSPSILKTWTDSFPSQCHLPQSLHLLRKELKINFKSQLIHQWNTEELQKTSILHRLGIFFSTSQCRTSVCGFSALAVSLLLDLSDSSKIQFQQQKSSPNLSFVIILSKKRFFFLI
jgi:hypothetical protein